MRCLRKSEANWELFVSLLIWFITLLCFHIFQDEWRWAYVTRYLIKINLEGWFPNPIKDQGLTKTCARLLKGKITKGGLQISLMCPGKGPLAKINTSWNDHQQWDVLPWFWSWLRPPKVLMLYYSRDRDEIFVVNLVFQLSPNTFFTWKKRCWKKSPKNKSSNLRLKRCLVVGLVVLEWSCKIAKKNPPTPPWGDWFCSRCALQQIRITFGKLQKWFAISWNWNRWERPVWLKIFLLRLLKRVNGNFWHWETPI